jgi:predicted RNA binding protein YcfA (HicA-like mRNA interferase family)
LVRQRGSHRIYRSGARAVTVPYHPGDLKRGTVKAIVQDAGLTLEQFLEYL